MELKLNISYKDLLKLIKQLPTSQIKKLKNELSDDLLEKTNGVKSNFQELLLNGPIMTDEQYESYIENRKNLNQWRTK